MTIISATDLTKNFKRAQKEPGFKGALKHLVKPCFNEFTAVDGVSFTIEEGEAVAYVGPNGAGKSTTVKLMTGILVPTSGDVSVCGLQPFQMRQTNARNIGVVFGQRTQLWWDIPVVESLRMLGDIYDVPATNFKSTMDELTEVLDLNPLLTVPARQLSLGQRMRCDLAASLIHSPKILYLDEPTIGLDVSVKARFREFVKFMNRERGLTVLLTSHDMGDIEELCPRMMMIDKGSLIYDGEFAEITRRFGFQQKLTLTLGEELADELDSVHKALIHRQSAEVSMPSAYVLEVTFDSRQSTSGEIISDLAKALHVVDLSIEETSAETIIRNLYEGSLSFEEQSRG